MCFLVLALLTSYFLQPKTLAVGCNDVGYFITFHTMGRQIVQGAPYQNSVPPSQLPGIYGIIFHLKALQEIFDKRDKKKHR
jgi:hypothetical protein